MSTLKRRPWVLTRSLLILAGCVILAGCAAGPMRPAANLPRPDGRYDNHAYLVDSSRMSLSQVVSSIVVLATRTDFELPDGTRLSKELVGSGVVVGGRYILTVDHAASQSGIEIPTPFGIMKPPVIKLTENTFLRLGGSDHLLKAVYRDQPNDIALFELPEGVRPPSFPYALGNSDDLRVGNYIYVVGNPMNLGVNVREGIVSALHAPKEISHVDAKGENAFMVSNGLVPGDSGTPVIAIRDGRFEMVGLSQGTFVGNNRLGWVIRINAIRLLLEGAHAVPKEMWTKAPTPTRVRVNAKKASILPPPFWGAVRVSP